MAKMYFIHSEEELLRYIPNVLSSVDGEATLMEKMVPDIMLSESWIMDNLIPAAQIGSLTEDLLATACKAVAACALYLAVPELDVVLTPNGFGIVSNQNVAPASKERVERLRTALLSQRDEAVGVLLKQLPVEMEAWRSSVFGQYYGGTLFPTFDVCALVGDKYPSESTFDKYRRLRTKILYIEQGLEERFFSCAQMAAFRQEVLAQSVGDSHSRVISMIKSYIIEKINLGLAPCSEAPLRAAVDIIRKDTDNFPEWHTSDMPIVWNPPVFQNKKENAGYWF